MYYKSSLKNTKKATDYKLFSNCVCVCMYYNVYIITASCNHHNSDKTWRQCKELVKMNFLHSLQLLKNVSWDLVIFCASCIFISVWMAKSSCFTLLERFYVQQVWPGHELCSTVYWTQGVGGGVLKNPSRFTLFDVQTFHLFKTKHRKAAL